MEQIYYTQCPIGYGLGASNGFQVKRITPGYPLGSDFRHFGLRAFPTGGRTLAPPTLRYRRTDKAEIAWLTPRAHEYETERGMWGRPGGHFAHGLILDTTELASINDWPAGLYGQQFWRKSDPEPSRGRLPDLLDLPAGIRDQSLQLGLKDLHLSNLELTFIAILMTAIAQVAREGRTLFLIDDPERLGPTIAGLTYLFPQPLRSELTFSTYHDRPEELPGFRIHGTSHAARPNRSVLLTQGMFVDIKAGLIEPPVTPSSWALAIVEGLSRADDRTWSDFANQLAKSTTSNDLDRWDELRLNHLISFGKSLRQDSSQLAWPELVEAMHWARVANLTQEWMETHGADWWLAIDTKFIEAREALLILASWRSAWTRSEPKAWGQVVARWFGGAAPADREAGVIVFVTGASTDKDRLAFLGALRRNLAFGQWPAIRERLKALFPADSRMSGSLAVLEGIASALQGDPAMLRSLVPRFHRSTEASLWLLEIASEETENDPAKIDCLCEPLASLFDRPDVFRWAVRRVDRALNWLRPFLRRRLAVPDSKDEWRALIKDSPTDFLPNLAAVLLDVTIDEGASDEAYLWVVDEVLLVIPEENRPLDQSKVWANRYLERSRSDLELIGRLYLRGLRIASLRTWLEGAMARGEIGLEQVSRLAHIKSLARTLDAKTLGPIEGIELARIPGSDRGLLLAHWLAQNRVNLASVLDQCGASWAKSLDPRSPDLAGLAKAVAESPQLASVRHDPQTWFHWLTEIAGHLEPETTRSDGFGPYGLISNVLAFTTRIPSAAEFVWPLRSHLLNNEPGWKCLAEDLRLDLTDHEPSASLSVVESWDHALSSRYRERLWEVVLNVSDGRRLGVIVSARAGDLQTLGPLRWWDHSRYPESCDDIRDAYSRLISLAPLDESQHSDVDIWMNSSRGYVTSNEKDRPWVSTYGWARWTCIDRLSLDLCRKGMNDQARRVNLSRWCRELPLSGLAIDDRYRLVAWMLYKIEDALALDTNQIGKWLVKSGLTDLDRITGWPNELERLVSIPPKAVSDRAELALKLRQEMRRVMDEMRESERGQFLRPPAID